MTVKEQTELADMIATRVIDKYCEVNIALLDAQDAAREVDFQAIVKDIEDNPYRGWWARLAHRLKNKREKL